MGFTTDVTELSLDCFGGSLGCEASFICERRSSDNRLDESG